MIRLLRTHSSDRDFQHLVKFLNSLLAELDGEEHAFYAPHNTLDALTHVVVAYHEDQPVACGALKPFDEGTAEVKRMYTAPAFRGKGIAMAVLTELESWALEDGFARCILETGIRQPDAIGLYQKAGYVSIPKYGPYAEMENSVCFEKPLI